MRQLSWDPARRPAQLHYVPHHGALGSLNVRARCTLCVDRRTRRSRMYAMPCDRYLRRYTHAVQRLPRNPPWGTVGLRIVPYDGRVRALNLCALQGLRSRRGACQGRVHDMPSGFEIRHHDRRRRHGLRQLPRRSSRRRVPRVFFVSHDDRVGAGKSHRPPRLHPARPRASHADVPPVPSDPGVLSLADTVPELPPRGRDARRSHRLPAVPPSHHMGRSALHASAAAHPPGRSQPQPAVSVVSPGSGLHAIRLPDMPRRQRDSLVRSVLGLPRSALLRRLFGNQDRQGVVARARQDQLPGVELEVPGLLERCEERTFLLHGLRRARHLG